MKISVEIDEISSVHGYYRVVLLDSEEGFYFKVKHEEHVAMLIHYLHGGSLNNSDVEILENLFSPWPISEE